MEAEKKPSFTEILDNLRKEVPHLNLPPNEKILNWKGQTPNHRLRLFVTPDQQWAYLCRGLTGTELKSRQASIPKNATDAEQELEYQVVAAGVLWTNRTPNNRFTADQLPLETAGIPKALYEIIGDLSDFYNPQELFRYTLDI